MRQERRPDAPDVVEGRTVGARITPLEHVLSDLSTRLSGEVYALGQQFLSMPSSRRLVFVDVHRALAIALALAAHALNDFDVPARLAGEEFVFVRLLTRAANPSFIFMFGMMLELVHARKVAERGLDIVTPRLLWRSLQCYFGYLATVGAGWMMGLFGTAHALQASVFIFGAHHGNVLQFYTVALILAVPLLAFRHRFGIWATIGLCASMWLLDPLFEMVQAVQVGRFTGIQTLLMQMMPHSLTFIGAGMLMGNALRRQRGRRTALRRRSLGMIAICGVVGAILIWQSGVGTVIDSYLDFYGYRNSFHVGYYAFGLIQAVGLTLILCMLFPLHSQRIAPSSSFLAFGRSSLLSFTIGNVVLNVTHGLGLVPGTAYDGLGWTLGYLGCVLGLVLVMEVLLRAVHSRTHLHILLVPAAVIQERVISPLAARMLYLLSPRPMP